MSRLDAARIAAELLRLDCRVGPLTVLDVTASTNDDARVLARSGCPHGAVVLADTQTAGRGRGSHRWHSPPGAGLYVSIVWRPKLEPSRLALLALAAGVGVARAVDAELERPRARIKWPNDVYVDERKVAGILVEAQVNSSLATVIIGVGLNIFTNEFPEELANVATSLWLAGSRELDRNSVAARLLGSLDGACRCLEGPLGSSLLDELMARDWLLGRSISVGELVGTATGIDRDGRLSLRTDDGRHHAVVAGEVSVRLKPV